ncbi:unnamed protein product [Closterium sp. NIES-65]|nr:unnamed protein product [Closterium sp. NIES-65]
MAATTEPIIEPDAWNLSRQDTLSPPPPPKWVTLQQQMAGHKTKPSARSRRAVGGGESGKRENDAGSPSSSSGDSGADSSGGGSSQTSDPAANVPEEFLCPLSLEIMRDPVIIASGQTYDRAYIERWFSEGRSSCPKTRQCIEHTNFCPNFALRSMIADWCAANDVSLPPITPIPASKPPSGFAESPAAKLAAGTAMATRKIETRATATAMQPQQQKQELREQKKQREQLRDGNPSEERGEAEDKAEGKAERRSRARSKDGFGSVRGAKHAQGEALEERGQGNAAERMSGSRSGKSASGESAEDGEGAAVKSGKKKTGPRRKKSAGAEDLARGEVDVSGVSSERAEFGSAERNCAEEEGGAVGADCWEAAEGGSGGAEKREHAHARTLERGEDERRGKGGEEEKRRVAGGGDGSRSGKERRRTASGEGLTREGSATGRRDGGAEAKAGLRASRGSSSSFGRGKAGDPSEQQQQQQQPFQEAQPPPDMAAIAAAAVAAVDAARSSASPAGPSATEGAAAPTQRRMPLRTTTSVGGKGARKGSGISTGSFNGQDTFDGLPTETRQKQARAGRERGSREGLESASLSRTRSSFPAPGNQGLAEVLGEAEHWRNEESAKRGAAQPAAQTGSSRRRVTFGEVTGIWDEAEGGGKADAETGPTGKEGKGKSGGKAGGRGAGLRRAAAGSVKLTRREKEEVMGGLGLEGVGGGGVADSGGDSRGVISSKGSRRSRNGSRDGGGKDGGSSGDVRDEVIRRGAEEGAKEGRENEGREKKAKEKRRAGEKGGGAARVGGELRENEGKEWGRERERAGERNGRQDDEVGAEERRVPREKGARRAERPKTPPPVPQLNVGLEGRDEGRDDYNADRGASGDYTSAELQQQEQGDQGGQGEKGGKGEQGAGKARGRGRSRSARTQVDTPVVSRQGSENNDPLHRRSAAAAAGAGGGGGSGAAAGALGSSGFGGEVAARSRKGEGEGRRGEADWERGARGDDSADSGRERISLDGGIGGDGMDGAGRGGGDGGGGGGGMEEEEGGRAGGGRGNGEGDGDGEEEECAREEEWERERERVREGMDHVRSNSCNGRHPMAGAGGGKGGGGAFEWGSQRGRGMGALADAAVAAVERRAGSFTERSTGWTGGGAGVLGGSGGGGGGGMGGGMGGVAAVREDWLGVRMGVDIPPHELLLMQHNAPSPLPPRRNLARPPLDTRSPSAAAAAAASGYGRKAKGGIGGAVSHGLGLARSKSALPPGLLHVFGNALGRVADASPGAGGKRGGKKENAGHGGGGRGGAGGAGEGVGGGGGGGGGGGAAAGEGVMKVGDGRAEQGLEYAGAYTSEKEEEREVIGPRGGERKPERGAQRAGERGGERGGDRGVGARGEKGSKREEGRWGEEQRREAELACLLAEERAGKQSRVKGKGSGSSRGRDEGAREGAREGAGEGKGRGQEGRIGKGRGSKGSNSGGGGGGAAAAAAGERCRSDGGGGVVSLAAAGDWLDGEQGGQRQGDSGTHRRSQTHMGGMLHPHTPTATAASTAASPAAAAAAAASAAASAATGGNRNGYSGHMRNESLMWTPEIDAAAAGVGAGSAISFAAAASAFAAASAASSSANASPFHRAPASMGFGSQHAPVAAAAAAAAPSMGKYAPLADALSLGSATEKICAARSIRAMVKSRTNGETREERRSFLEAGVLEALIAALATHTDEWESGRAAAAAAEEEAVVENVMNALLALLLHWNAGPEVVLAGGIPSLVSVLQHATPAAQATAAAALYVLAKDDENRSLVRTGGAIPALVRVMETGSARGRKDAALALFALSLSVRCARDIVGAGAIPLLLSLIGQDENDDGGLPGMEEKAAAVLLNLSRLPEACEEIAAQEGGVGVTHLIDLLDAGACQRSKEDAAGVLLAMLQSEVVTVQALRAEGAIPSLVRIVGGSGGGGAAGGSGGEGSAPEAKELLQRLRQG